MDAETLRDIFRNLGSIHIRRMFGGQGVYRGDLMFALEADGELYLKADEESIEVLQGVGSRPFTYETRDSRTTLTSYWLMPESALDDPDEARDFAAMAIAVAQRAKGRKGRKAAAARKTSRNTRKPASESAT